MPPLSHETLTRPLQFNLKCIMLVFGCAKLKYVSFRVGVEARNACVFLDERTFCHVVRVHTLGNEWWR